MLSPRARSTSLRVNCVEGSIKTDSSTPLRSARNDETGFSHTLSDLIPDYLGEETLLCPSDPDHKAQYSPDTKLPCSYSWKLSSDQIPVGWDPTRRTLYRDWKTQQAKLFGDVVPMVRCHHHGTDKVLNVSMGGKIYWSRLDWELMFKPDYRFGDERRYAWPNELLQVAMPPAIAGAAQGTVADVDIVREAVARQLGKKPQKLIDGDYKKVEQLDLSRSEISDIQPLEALNGLKKLHLYDTRVSKLEPLKTMTNLRELRLSRTRVSDEEAVELEKALPKVRIYR